MHDKYGKLLAVGDLVLFPGDDEMFAPLACSFFITDIVDRPEDKGMHCSRCNGRQYATGDGIAIDGFCGCVLHKLDGDIGEDEREGEKVIDHETT